jgi:hypothetical protein
MLEAPLSKVGALEQALLLPSPAVGVEARVDSTEARVTCMELLLFRTSLEDFDKHIDQRLARGKPSTYTFDEGLDDRLAAGNSSDLPLPCVPPFPECASFFVSEVVVEAATQTDQDEAAHVPAGCRAAMPVKRDGRGAQEQPKRHVAAEQASC